MLLGVDRQVAKLLGVLDAEVGEGRWLLAFTADHGVAFPPESIAARGIPSSRVDMAEVLKRVNRRLDYQVRYLDWSLGFLGSGYWFDPEALRWGGKPAGELEEIVAGAIRETPGMGGAWTRTDILAGRLPGDDIGRRIAVAYHPDRSPDVYVWDQPYWIEGGTASHGEPYNYDAHVPLIFLGAGVPPREIFRPVDIRDLAATMSAVLGSAPPSACTGTPLEEVTGMLRTKRRSF